jgi:hypothetical protein
LSFAPPRSSDTAEGRKNKKRAETEKSGAAPEGNLP